MKKVFGELSSLKANLRNSLEKLSHRRTSAEKIIDVELARRGAEVMHEAGVQLGLIIGRDGHVEYTVLGTKDRIYLPDLGRFRVAHGRLRRLRLVVFVPVKNNRVEPEISFDLLTDLEKLRLDALIVIGVDHSGKPAAVSGAYLAIPDRAPAAKTTATRERSLTFFTARTLHELDIDFLELISELDRRLSNVQERAVETGKDQAVLIGAYTSSAHDSQASMDELVELARTADIKILDTMIQRRRTLDPKTVVGIGKIEEIVLHCLDLGAEMIIFDRELSPGQLRSIARLTDLKVLDRSMLILDIFAQRAKTSEGRLQVELAQLKYSLPRLTETDSGLSRLSGGIGGRGPGETKLEIGRRRARDRIVFLEGKIDKLGEQRGLRRQRRQNRGVPTVAIVGYTNAGKSTLLNTLTKGDVFVENKLFATLDPSSRRMRFPNEKEVIFVDTVGFIRELPKELVAAFRATLEEVNEADFLLHVVDASDPQMRHQMEVVENTLSDLGYGDKPKQLVLNKIDLLSEIEVKTLTNSLEALPVSALQRKGLATLISIVQNALNETFKGRDPGGFLEY